MQYHILPPRHTTGANISLPASKSLSNRALIIRGLCTDDCRLGHLSDCDDTEVMIASFDHPSDTIDIGAAGTSMRFLTAYFATQADRTTLLTGSERMRHRPIGVLVDALRTLGARIEYADQNGFPPLRITGRRLQGGSIEIDGSVSSQYISALLLVAPCLSDGLTLHLTGQIISKPYIRMTLGLMAEFGIDSEWNGAVIKIRPQAYAARSYEVESDWSAASYWYEVMAISEMESIRLKGLKSQSWQGDAAIAHYFEALGVATTYESDGVLLTRQGKAQKRVEWDLSDQPDLAQTLITTCTALNVEFDISGLQTLKIKETDRITALQNELRKLGYAVSESNGNRMMWQGERCEADRNPIIATYEDHRMAMAFAPLTCRRGEQGLTIDHPQVVSKSYPAFWEDLRNVGFLITETE